MNFCGSGVAFESIIDDFLFKKVAKKISKQQKITIFVERTKPKNYEEGNIVVIGGDFRVGRIV